jgi:hypothetical protein
LTLTCDSNAETHTTILRSVSTTSKWVSVSRGHGRLRTCRGESRLHRIKTIAYMGSSTFIRNNWRNRAKMLLRVSYSKHRESSKDSSRCPNVSMRR